MAASRNVWRDDEVNLLINLWSDHFADLHKTKRNRSIYEKISKEMHVFGYSRDWKEISNKIKNLQRDYRKEKTKASGTGTSPSTWPFYDKVHAILGTMAYNDDSLLSESFIDSQGAEDSEHSYASRDAAVPGCSRQVIDIDIINSEEVVIAEDASDLPSTINHQRPEKRRKKTKDELFEEMLADFRAAENRAAETDKEIISLMKEQNSLIKQLIEK